MYKNYANALNCHLARTSIASAFEFECIINLKPFKETSPGKIWKKIRKQTVKNDFRSIVDETFVAAHPKKYNLQTLMDDADR